MKALTRNEAAAFLLSCDHYTILTHTRPDGDTVGSAAALCLGLRSLGKTAHVLENSEVSPKFSWLHQGLTKAEAEEGDTIVSVDVASPGMLPERFAPLAERTVLRIDHHGSATSFSELETVDPHSASCAELVWDILTEMGVQGSPALLDAVYVGLSTDTGCFRYANTTGHSFSVAAACAAGGARVFELNQELFETNSLGRLRMQAWMIEHMQLLREGQLAIVAIPRETEQALGVTKDDMDNISSFPRTVAGVRMAATLRESEDGRVKLSVRAVPGYDAAKVTECFGGGGHKGAAGGIVALPLQEAAQAVAKAMLEVCP